MRNQVFISYCHADSEYLLRLKIHLRPFEREGKVIVWSDTKINTGELWKKEIGDALNKAAAAILLISADFLASEFIVDNELPPLLSACEQEGVKILPVILKPCAFLETGELAKFQSINPPIKSVLAMEEHEREALWHEVSKNAAQALKEFAKEGSKRDIVFPMNMTTYDTQEQDYENAFDFGFGFIEEFLKHELENPQSISEYYVYQYHHVDILEFMPKAEELLKPFAGSTELIKNVKKRLKSEGWEGDGTLQLLWIPPFVGAGSEDTWGVLTWFIKQSNNGTAFICTPIPLPFSRLLEQNR